MRLRNLCFIFAVGSLASACKKSEPAATTSPAGYYGFGGTAGDSAFLTGPDVAMIMRCVGDDNVMVNVVAWRRVVAKNETIKWKLHQTGVDSVILRRVAGNTAPWPFTDTTDIVVRKGQEVTRVRTDANASDTTFRYAIKSTCKRANSTVEDTVVVDPIMILPR